MTDPQNPADAPAPNVPPAPPAYGAPQSTGSAPSAGEPQYGAAPPAYGGPQYASAPAAPAGPPPGDTYPGKTLGIVAVIVVFFASIIGLILGYVARSQSKAAGYKNTPAKVAIILGWIFLVLGIIAGIIITVVVVTAGANALNELCAGMPPGEYPLTTGGTVTCP